ncbi:MAG: FAD-binding protein [Lentisphaerae bacterium]|nr:FAD-binding protein [Lentisphaerota bacterium]
MPRLTIDGRSVRVEHGETILDAAHRLRIGIPTLCHDKAFPPFTSCMVCMVCDTRKNRLHPACSALAEDGMEIVTGSPEVLEARRQALELLLSEHVGDCDAPCRRACPAGMNIPLMIRQIAGGNPGAALATVLRHIAIPGVLGRICQAPCEKACRRGRHDAPVAICLLKRYAADFAGGVASGVRCAAASGKKTFVVGSGPAGLSAAYFLARFGHACTVIEAADLPGGTLRSAVPEEDLPREVLDREIARIASAGVVFSCRTALGKDVALDGLLSDCDAVVLAAGVTDPAVLKAMGLDAGDKGIRLDSATLSAGRRGVFAAGAVAGVGGRMAVRTAAEGRAAAVAADAFLRGGACVAAKRFCSVVGKLEKADMDAFLSEASSGGRVAPAGGKAAGFTAAEAREEAARCLHCDCRKVESCRLREHSTALAATAARFKGESRLPVTIRRQHAEVIYEPGKCIKCGLCVRATEQESEKLGLAFIGRGFDVRVDVPFGETLADGLKKAARRCVEICPTGALAFERGDDPSVEAGNADAVGGDQ